MRTLEPVIDHVDHQGAWDRGVAVRRGAAGSFVGVSEPLPNPVLAWLVRPRASEADGRLVVRYAGGVMLLWWMFAVAGVGYGFATVGGDDAQAAYIGLGLGAICTFVAWFAARPVVVADRSGLAVLPVFGTRTALRWDEVRAIGVRSTRRSRGRGASLEIQATEDREVQIDGAWMGLVASSLRRIDARLGQFIGSLQLGTSIAALADDDTDDTDDTEPFSG